MTCRVIIFVMLVWCARSTCAKEAGLADESGLSDQILLVSTRGYACCVGTTLHEDSFQAIELSPCGDALPERVPLVSHDPRFVNTVVWVHGNQIPADEAIRRGLMVYRRIRQFESSGPIRFVIWSWPSVRVSGRLKDAREKAIRTDVEAFLLASYVNRAAGEGPVNLIGYSFGARIITGALHLVEGGTLSGYFLPNRQEARVPFRVTLMAAAVANTAVTHGGRNQFALRNVETLVLQNNSKDRALNLFPITQRAKPRALGDTGLACAPFGCRVQQFDWANWIGHDHSLMEYIDRPAIMRRVAQQLSR